MGAIDHDGGVARLQAGGDLVQVPAVIEVHTEAGGRLSGRVQRQPHQGVPPGVLEGAGAGLDDDGPSGVLGGGRDALNRLQVVGDEPGQGVTGGRGLLQGIGSVQQHHALLSRSRASASASVPPTFPAKTM
jgi:hypothetical protein